mmetsp:Transcript_28977/g.81620  ORF Transcript_28977/g.81620 Transcript_28977/m.81620 type:complete len:203 (+) Transcript_28977:2293-2901(+)
MRKRALHSVTLPRASSHGSTYTASPRGSEPTTTAPNLPGSTSKVASYSMESTLQQCRASSSSHSASPSPSSCQSSRPRGSLQVVMRPFWLPRKSVPRWRLSLRSGAKLMASREEGYRGIRNLATVALSEETLPEPRRRVSTRYTPLKAYLSSMVSTWASSALSFCQFASRVASPPGAGGESAKSSDAMASPSPRPRLRERPL